MSNINIFFHFIKGSGCTCGSHKYFCHIFSLCCSILAARSASCLFPLVSNNPPFNRQHLFSPLLTFFQFNLVFQQISLLSWVHSMCFKLPRATQSWPPCCHTDFLIPPELRLARGEASLCLTSCLAEKTLVVHKFSSFVWFFLKEKVGCVRPASHWVSI